MIPLEIRTDRPFKKGDVVDLNVEQHISVSDRVREVILVGEVTRPVCFDV